MKCQCSGAFDMDDTHFQNSARVASAEWDSLATNVLAMKCEMCFPLECHQSAKFRTSVVWEACKRKSQCSSCPRSFQLCCIYCDS